ncbi:MAG: PspA/IM30 family protein [Opitutaceae bacterium]
MPTFHHENTRCPHFRRRRVRGTGIATSWAAQPAAYVPRSDYEQLKAELDSLRARLDALAPATVSVVPGNATEAAPRRTSPRLGLDLSNFRSGWERFRSSDWAWMDHDRVDEMNARIAAGESFELLAGMTSAERFQALQQRNVVTGGKTPARLEPGFQTAWGSFEFLADFDRKLEV